LRCWYLILLCEQNDWNITSLANSFRELDPAREAKAQQRQVGSLAESAIETLLAVLRNRHHLVTRSRQTALDGLCSFDFVFDDQNSLTGHNGCWSLIQNYSFSIRREAEAVKAKATSEK
jgi:hypothetical protein